MQKIPVSGAAGGVGTGEAPKFKCPTENGETDAPLVASLCGRCQTQIQTQWGI